VHYDAEAVRHAYLVATGLDSMVIGESQILGQLRDAYAVAAEQDATGRLLHELMQQALRVGKRAHAETGIDRAGQSIVSAALDLAGPRDVAPTVAQVPGVRLIDLEWLGEALRERGGFDADRAAVEAIVRAEVEAFLSWLRGLDVAPTLAALRGRADEVVAAE